MKNQLKALIVGAIIALTGLAAPAQTTNSVYPSTFQGSIDAALAAFEGVVSNCYIIPYYIRANGLPQKNGGGVALCLPVNKYLVTAIRMDYVDGDFWMPNGSATLQLPITLGSTGLMLTPFTYAGLGVPVSGASFTTSLGTATVPGHAKDNNGQATGIIGLGASIRLYTSSDQSSDLNLVGDAEKWTGFAQNQYRVGLAYHSNKPGLFGMGLNLGIIRL